MSKTVYSDWATASYPFGATATRCYLTVSDVQLTSAVNARVDISGAMQSKDGAALDGWGVRVTIGHWETAAGKPTGTKAATGVLRKTAWVGNVSDYWNFERTHSAYQVALFSEYTGQEVDGYAGIKQSGHVEYKVTIPAKPSYAVKFNANGGAGAPAAAVKWHGEALTLPATAPTRANHTFVGWATSSNATSANYQPGGSYTANAAVTLYAVWKINPPVAPTACSVERVGDNRNDVSWTLAEGSAALNAAVLIERSIDGGAWSQAASVAGSATSWSDTSTAANHAYRYRVRASNASGKSAYATSGTVYNTPAAPVSVTASRTGEASVSLAIDNPANTATALQYEYAATTAGGGTVATVEGSRVTSTTANPGGGTWYFRARNTRGELVSAWSPWSDPVVTICPPSAPTPTAPASGAVVSKEQPLTAFSWLHNAPDGSDQTAAELQWRIVGDSWATATATDAQSADIDLSAVPANSAVEWQVRTKGAHADWSPWSAVSRFTVAAPPQVSFKSPATDAVIATVPVMLDLSYSDESGEAVSVSFSVRGSDGVIVYSADNGTELSREVPASEWLPEDGASYMIRADVRSSSTLAASADVSVSVKYVLPESATVAIEPDETTGYVNLTVRVIDDPSLAPCEAVSVSRIVGNFRKPLGEGLSDGAAVVDRYAPMRKPYGYEVVSRAASGAVSVTRVPYEFDSVFAYVYGISGTILRGSCNPKEPIGITHPNRTLKYYAGRTLPVMHDTGHVQETRSYGFRAHGADAAEAAYAVGYQGRGILKSHSGDVLHVAIDVSLEPEFSVPTIYGGIQLDMTRIDGEAL